MKLNKLVSTLDMDHETWLQYRKKGIGGSDAGSICGLNPYSTAISVFQDKTQLQAEEKADNEAMRQGRDLEEYVAIHEHCRYDQGYGARDQESAAAGDHTGKIYKDGSFCAEYHSETCRVQSDVFSWGSDECSTAWSGT